MLSPGTHYRDVPRDPDENLRYRQWVVTRAARSRRFREKVIDVCRHDVVYYINTFVYQFNPKAVGPARAGPFIAWDFQEEALLDRPETTGRKGILWCVEHRKSAVVEKSRDMGISWTFLIAQDWLAQSQDYWQSLNISRDADAVDCGSPDSLFWKIRFMHQHLPEWLLGPVTTKKFFFEYHRTKSFITGEASTGKAGVGGRASVAFIDEAPLIDAIQEVRERTANTTDCRFFNGTHNGNSGTFFELCNTPEFVKVQCHWRRHPEKSRGLYTFNAEKQQVEVLDKSYFFPPDFNFVMDGKPVGGPEPGIRSPWYDSKCIDIGSSRAIAQELDINPAGSAATLFDQAVVNNLIRTYAFEPYWEGDVVFKADNPAGTAELVSSPGGPLKLWCHLDVHGRPPAAPYAGGADVAAGSGATPSCISFANCKTGEKVLEYTNARIYPQDLAPVAVALCSLFADVDGLGVMFAWEQQGPGDTFGKHVIELGYRRVYYKRDPLVIGQAADADRPGWSPLGKNKPMLLRDYQAALQSHRFINRSEPALLECLAFKFDRQGKLVHANEASHNDPSGATVNHADHVIGDALCSMMMQLSGQPRTGKEKEKADPPFNSLLWRRQEREADARRRVQWV